MSSLRGVVPSRTSLNREIEPNKPSVAVNMQSGARGRSAHELWLEEGNVGTIDDFLNSLKAMGNIETFVHKQIIASSIWSVEHNLDKYPSTTIVDTGGNVAIGDVTYLDSITISFASAPAEGEYIAAVIG